MKEAYAGSGGDKKECEGNFSGLKKKCIRELMLSTVHQIDMRMEEGVLAKEPAQRYAGTGNSQGSARRAEQLDPSARSQKYLIH